MGEWYRVGANSATRDVWIETHWTGKAPVGPWLLSDGREIDGLIADGHIDELSFPVWFTPQSNRGERFGDLLWTLGSAIKIASTKMVSALAGIEATGYRTFDIDLRNRQGDRIPDYVGFATTSDDELNDVRHLFGYQNVAFLAAPRVIQALRAAGADQLGVELFDLANYKDVL